MAKKLLGTITVYAVYEPGLSVAQKTSWEDQNGQDRADKFYTTGDYSAGLPNVYAEGNSQIVTPSFQRDSNDVYAVGSATPGGGKLTLTFDRTKLPPNQNLTIAGSVTAASDFSDANGIDAAANRARKMSSIVVQTLGFRMPSMNNTTSFKLDKELIKGFDTIAPGQVDMTYNLDVATALAQELGSKILKSVSLEIDPQDPVVENYRVKRTVGYVVNMSRVQSRRLFVVQDTQSNVITLSMTSEGTSNGMTEAAWLKQLDDNLVLLNEHAKDCQLGNLKQADFDVPIPISVQPALADDLEAKKRAYDIVVSRIFAEGNKVCDLNKVEERATAAGQTVEDYIASIDTRVADAKVAAKDKTWWSTAFDWAKDSTSAIGGYLSQWSPQDLLLTWGGYEAIKSAKKSSIPLWLMAGVAAILILK